jgi:small-conductance mechanosensitive channel
LIAARRAAGRVYLFLLLLFAATAAVSAAPAPGPALGTTSAAASLTAAQAQVALDVLNDPAKRAQLVATLDAIVKAANAQAGGAPAAPVSTASGATTAPKVATTGPATAGPAAATAVAPAAAPAAAEKPAPKVTLAPDSLGAAVLMGASGFINQFSARALRTVRAVQGFPLLWGWIVVMATNPLAHTLLREAAWRVAVAFAVGLLVELGVRYLLRQPISILEARSPDGTHPPLHPAASEDPEARAEDGEIEAPRARHVAARTLLRRLPLVFLRFLLELLPVAGFAVAGHVMAATRIGGSEQTRLIVLAMVDAYVLCSGLVCVARMMLSPETPRLRLMRISDATAVWATRWIRRILVVGVFGYAIAEVGMLLGMLGPAHDGVLKLSALINHVFVGIMVLQKRRAVKQRIRAPAGATGISARLRNAIAPVWHWVALFFLAATWFVWAVEIRHGVMKVLHFFVVTVAVVIAARLISIVLLGVIDRMLRVSPELAERYPGLETRLRAYNPLLQTVARGLISLAAVLVLLEIWGLGLFEWLTGSFLGHRLAAATGTMLLTLALGLFVWEACNTAIEAHLTRLSRDQQVARSARLRTLLPLLRTSLLVAIMTIAGLTVLSEVGINIAPLLAGAGIIGVAIGFGSQKLVQDLITGIFLLLENAMQVGDWVTVSGLSGSVENLSIRTIRLRAGDGSVHIIPFSSVTSVTNTNRGLGNAAVSVVISFREDIDHAAALLKEIAVEMRKEPDYATRMLNDLQLWGVDKVDGAAVTLSGQIPCTDSGRWPVQREFNRRMKIRFQELEIAIWNPAQTYVVPGAPGTARPALTGPQEAAAE